MYSNTTSTIGEISMYSVGNYDIENRTAKHMYLYTKYSVPQSKNLLIFFLEGRGGVFSSFFLTSLNYPNVPTQRTFSFFKYYYFVGFFFLFPKLDIIAFFL